jgi:hypothetical protein
VHEEEKKQAAYELPILKELPTFKKMPLIVKDASGKTRLNDKVAIALVAALTLTIKDVFRFAEKLTMSSDTNVPSEQMLVMLDCRGYDIRQLYWHATLDFVMTFLPKQWMEVFAIPPEHIATVLLHLYNSQYQKWETCSKAKGSRSLSTQDKHEIPVLVVDALEQAAFL